MPGKPGSRLREDFVERPAREAARRAKEESDRLASELTQEVNRILVKAYINRQRFDAVNSWLKRTLPPVFKQHEGNTPGLLEALRAYRIPDRLTGRVKQRRIGDANLPALLRKYEALKERAAKAARGKVLKFLALWTAFPELAPHLCDLPGRFFPEKFAKQVLADEFGCEIPTIEKALTRARKARQQ